MRREGTPLLVGLAPAAWGQYLNEHAVADDEERLHALLHGALEGVMDASDGVRRQHLARIGRAPMPLPCQSRWSACWVSSYGACAPRYCPPTLRPTRIWLQLASANALFGAALALATKFPERCRDKHGFFDGPRIAQLIMEKTALWFPDTPPALTERDMAALIEQYLT